MTVSTILQVGGGSLQEIVAEPRRRGRAIAELSNDLISVGKDLADTNWIEQPRVVEW